MVTLYNKAIFVNMILTINNTPTALLISTFNALKIYIFIN